MKEEKRRPSTHPVEVSSIIHASINIKVCVCVFFGSGTPLTHSHVKLFFLFYCLYFSIVKSANIRVDGKKVKGQNPENLPIFPLKNIRP
jgi:hypothetical protein